MFEYLVEKRNFKQKLGNYISHEVVTYFDGNKRIYRTLEELENMDKLELARTFYNKTHRAYFEGGIPGEDMIDDIALYIEKRIPHLYERNRIRRLEK